MLAAIKTNTPFESKILQLNESGDHIVVDLHWPAPLGCINDALLNDFEKLCDYLEDISSAQIIIFRGFKGEIEQDISKPSIDQCNRWEKILNRLTKLSVITIAAIDGNCARFCLQLALVCDYRLATENSQFISPEIKEGYLPGMTIFQLAKFVGLGIARRIIFSGQFINAKDAHNYGLLDVLCTSNQLTQELNNLVDQITPINGTVIQLSRRLLNESFADNYEKAIGHFLAAQYNCLNQNNRS